MKKILLLISIIGLFALTGCDSTEPYYVSSNSNQPTQENTSQNEPTNTQSSTTKDITTTSKSDNVYNDDINWGPFH